MRPKKYRLRIGDEIVGYEEWTPEGWRYKPTDGVRWTYLYLYHTDKDQFTSLCDFYGGDILENEVGSRVVVEWDERTLSWDARFLDEKDRPEDQIESISLFLWYNFSHKKAKIIGNVFQNKDLMEKK